jgi:hypothetical protein
MENHEKSLRILWEKGSYRSGVQELMHNIRVPLRDSYDEVKFEHEDPKTPAWSPPYQDGQEWSDVVLEDDGDIRHWPLCSIYLPHDQGGNSARHCAQHHSHGLSVQQGKDRADTSHCRS